MTTSQVTFNASAIDALPIPPKGNKFHGFAGAMVHGKPIPRGLGVVVTANGVRSFVLNYNLRGRERRYTIGRVGEYNVPSAIERARVLREQISNGYDPLEVVVSREAVKNDKTDKTEVVWKVEDRKPKAAATPEKAIRDLWIAWERARQREGKRDPKNQRVSFNKHILPVIGDLPFKELRKSQIVNLRDSIHENIGPVAANRAVAYLLSVLNWQEDREDEWRAPRAPKALEETSRTRVLKPQEIAALWPVFEGSGFGQLCRLLLLTGSRRSEIGDLLWSDIDWHERIATIPADRYKAKEPHVIPLSAPALAILEAIERRPDGRVFSVMDYGRGKRVIDAKVQLAEHWTLHDLRRTARSMLAAEGISSDIAARVLGHTIPGVDARVYDLYSYLAEKRQAVDTLARAIERTVNPEPAKVVNMRG
jgi:integrase